MSEMMKVVQEPLAVEAIERSPQVKTSEGVATTVETGFAITCHEDREQANDSALIVKRGIKAIEDGLTEAFRPFKAIERTTRDKYAPVKARLENALRRIDEARGKWDREEAARVREAQRIAQAELDAQAKAAREAAPALPDDEELPGAAQIVMPQVESTTRGALATASKTKRVVAAELVDPNAARDEWGQEVVTLDAKLARERYAAKMKLGLLDYPKDGGVVVGGIRFVTEESYTDRARSGR